MGLVRPLGDSPEERAAAVRRARKALDRWLARHPEVDAWVAAQFEKLAPSKFEIAYAIGRAALRGSVPHADWMAEVCG